MLVLGVAILGLHFLRLLTNRTSTPQPSGLQIGTKAAEQTEGQAEQAAVPYWTEANFRSLLDAAPDAMLVVDTEGIIVVANRQSVALFAYAHEELIGKPVELLIPERFRNKHPQHRTGFFTDPRVRPMGMGLELFAVRSDGAEFPVEISLSPLRTMAGSLAIAAIRDMTERRRAEEQFRGLLESAPDAMVIVDQKGTITLVNSQVEKLFGFSR